LQCCSDFHARFIQFTRYRALPVATRRDHIGIPMSDLVIRIKKRTDGGAALSCTRADGSVTWQRQDGAQGYFFPYHDLTHYAVETVLGHTRGFFGLVAEGWDLFDFGKPWPRGALPQESLVAERIVGLLDQERAAGKQWSAAEINEVGGLGDDVTLADGELAAVRARRSELFAQWAALPTGETLVLAFTRATATARR